MASCGPRRPAIAASVLAIVGVALLTAPGSLADDVALPVAKQMELLAKVADYDRNFHERAGTRARVVILEKAGDGDSVRTAIQMQAALSHIDAVAGLPHDDAIETYGGPAALAEECRSKHVAIIIVGPGFRDDVDAIRTALDGVDVLTVSAVADYVPRGIVLGFDLVGGRPKMLVQLTQAKRQHVTFVTDVLRLMQVYQ
jgi:hypothetical protein